MLRATLQVKRGGGGGAHPLHPPPPPPLDQSPAVYNQSPAVYIIITIFSLTGKVNASQAITGGVLAIINFTPAPPPLPSIPAACDPGTFRALTVSRTCQTCPANSMLDAEATSKCECRPGFFRRDVPGEEEGPEKGCTGEQDLGASKRSQQLRANRNVHPPKCSQNPCCTPPTNSASVSTPLSPKVANLKPYMTYELQIPQDCYPRRDR